MFVSRMGLLAELLVIKAAQMTKYQMFNVFKLILTSVLLSLMMFRTNAVIMYLCIIIIIIVMFSCLLKHYENGSSFAFGTDLQQHYNIPNNSDNNIKRCMDDLSTPSSFNQTLSSKLTGNRNNIKINKNKLKEFRQRSKTTTTESKS